MVHKSLTKQLYIYRHADALPATDGQADHDRTLSTQGESEAARIGAFLKEAGIAPDFALCSTAARTRSTLEQTCLAMERDLEVAYEPGLYLASPGDLFQYINGVEDTVESLMVVAHNPGVHEFCRMLVKRGDRVGQGEIATRFPTATLALIKLPIAHWAELSPVTDGELLGVAIPKQTA